jgi:dTDP-4-amino-4,6-dideoxygalactose transaminase
MYHHKWVGWNSRLDALQAAVLRVKLPHLPSWSDGRAANANRYDAMFTESGLVGDGTLTLPYRAPNARHIFNQYTLRAQQRDDLREHLRSQGIGHAVYYPVPLHLQECFAELGHEKGDFPEAERACEEVLALPVYPELTEQQQERVVSAVVGFYKN